MFCSNCGKTIEQGSAFCKECGAPVLQVETMGGAAGLEAGLEATQVRSAASPEPSGVRSAPPSPGYMPPPPPPPSGYLHMPGGQAPPPRRRKGLSVGIAAAVVIVLAGAAVGTYFGLRGSSSDGPSSSTTVFAESTSTSLAEVSTTVTVPSVSSSTTVTTTTSPNVTTSMSTSSSMSTTTSPPTATTTTPVLAPDARLHSPASGSPERKAILDVLRVPVEKELNQAVVFVIETIKVENDFAFVLGRSVQPNGAAIDYSKTPYLKAVQAGGFSDEAIGLLHWSGGSWKLLTYNVGATDVAWLDWAQTYGAPQAIFPSGGN